MSKTLTAVDRSSRQRMTRFAVRFFTGETLLARLGRAVCRAEALSRKEFFETWEVARSIRKRVRGRPVLELAAGHGLLAALMIILDDSIATATCVDKRKPVSHDRLMEALEEAWPRLAGRVSYQERAIEPSVPASGSLAVSVHGCGAVTDQVLDIALAARCAVAVLPCCHDFDRSDDGGLRGWMEPTLAIDAARAGRLAHAGYRIITTTVPAGITPRNRLLIGWPRP